VDSQPTSDAVSETIERAVMAGDLADLTNEQRAEYYTTVCRSLGLNPFTKPFEFLTLNGKLRLYALRDCAYQLRRLHGISIYITNRERMGDIYIVTARAKDRTGRKDESTGAVPLGNLKGDALANALMKAETKSKRRVTLSIAGLGWLDETELETIPQRHVISHDPDPLPAGESMSHSVAEEHPTADDITRLVETARAANVDLEAFGHDMRQLMHLPESQKVTKKFLREQMTMDQYNTARAHYGEALRQILEGDVPNHEPPAEAVDADASQAVQEAAAEGTPAVPSGADSASVPAPDPNDAAERDRQRLRAEVAAWDLRVKPEEIEHVIQHNPYSKAGQLLWKYRRQDTAAD
jgi:hypothetical protein